MSEGFKGLIISFILVGLFAFAMINFGVQLSLENDSNQSILENSAINRSYHRLESNLTELRDEAQTQKEGFEGEDPKLEGGSLLFKSIVGAGKTFSSTITSVWIIISDVAYNVFGINEIILGVLASILLVTIIFLAWRAYKAGS